MWAQILCYKNQGIHWYHCNPTFLWQINFRLVRRLISALIWDISGLWNRSDGRDYREKRIVISRFLVLYNRLEYLLWYILQISSTFVIQQHFIRRFIWIFWFLNKFTIIIIHLGSIQGFLLQDYIGLLWKLFQDNTIW